MKPQPQLDRILNLIHKSTSPSHIHQIQAQLILQNLHSNTTVGYHFITTSQSLSLLPSAALLYTHHLPKPHVFICNTLLSSFAHTNSPHDCLSFYTHMHKNSISPNNYTFPLILKSLTDLKDVKLGESVHTQVVKLGHLSDFYVGNSVLNLYASSGDIFLSRRVFDEMPLRDVVSRTVMINGYRVCGWFDYALLTFEQMQFAGVVPNRVTMLIALAASSAIGALDTGVWIHNFITRNGWELDVRTGTCLIDMYGKCGRVEAGLSVFDKMNEGNVFTWNALIKGYTLAKSGEEAIMWFYRMMAEGVRPDEVTLVAVLCACVHSGLFKRGRKIFSFLVNGKYGLSPGAKHYTCMVDLLARSGCLMEAQKIINEMPCLPTKSVWRALLAGCRAHGNLELGEFAAWQLIELEPENSAYYVVLYNLYADVGRWSEVEEVRSLMKERGLKKDSGSSSLIELEPELEPIELEPLELELIELEP